MRERESKNKINLQKHCKIIIISEFMQIKLLLISERLIFQEIDL